MSINSEIKRVMKESLSTSDSTASRTTSTPSSALSGGRIEGTPKSARASQSMTKRMLTMLGLMFLFIAAIGAWKAWQIKTGIAMAAKFAPAPLPSRPPWPRQNNGNPF